LRERSVVMILRSVVVAGFSVPPSTSGPGISSVFLRAIDRRHERVNSYRQILRQSPNIVTTSPTAQTQRRPSMRSSANLPPRPIKDSISAAHVSWVGQASGRKRFRKSGSGRIVRCSGHRVRLRMDHDRPGLRAFFLACLARAFVAVVVYRKRRDISISVIPIAVPRTVIPSFHARQSHACSAYVSARGLRSALRYFQSAAIPSTSSTTVRIDTSAMPPIIQPMPCMSIMPQFISDFGRLLPT